MNFPLYSDVILLRDLPEEDVYNGDIGTVVVRVASPLVDRHDVAGLETGYSVEVFDMLGNTVAFA